MFDLNRKDPNVERPKHLPIKTSLYTFLFLAFSYLATLLVLDVSNQIFTRLPDFLMVLPVLFASSFSAYLLRYFRWSWLLARRGHTIPAVQGFLGYLSGFAFTASPGKMGELVRIRYFSRWGVKPERVISVFIFERLLDLFVLLAFASLLALVIPGFKFVIIFIMLVLLGILIGARLRFLRLWLIPLFDHQVWRLPARMLHALLRGLDQTMCFFNLHDFLVSIGLGFAAWGVQCMGFMGAFIMLGISLELLTAFAIQPTAMIIGAASMMPGGIGTTEAASVFLLRKFGAPLDLAILASIAMRIGSMWFSIFLGLGAIFRLEAK